eukprot:Hpha_TRINITY_DN11636_c0_g1::TRINITY_DN11636_c0_g1_i1::g.49136::m.49136
MRRYGDPSDPNLRNKVIAGMALVSVVLLWLLAYTLGSGVQESKDVQAQTSLEDQVKVIRGRLKLCQSKTLKQAANLGKNELDVETLRAENDLLERENTLLQQTNDDLEKTALECEEDSQNERDRRNDLGQASVVDVIDRMRFENKNLEAEKNAINATNRQRIQTIRNNVQAYRIENDMLRKQLIKQREEEERAARATPEPTKAVIKPDAKLDAELRSQTQAKTESDAEAPPPPVVALEPVSCVDSDKQCPTWAESGECKRNPTFMNRKCRKSCGECPPPPSGIQAPPPPVGQRSLGGRKRRDVLRGRGRDPDEGPRLERLDDARRRASQQLGFSD